MFANFMWAVLKPDIRICFSHRFVEGRGEGAGWVFRLVHINLFICLIQNLLQVLLISLLLCIIHLCLFTLLYQSSLIMSLVLGCVKNCLWAVSKQDINLCFPCRFEESYVKSSGCVVSLAILNRLNVFN